MRKILRGASYFLPPPGAATFQGDVEKDQGAQSAQDAKLPIRRRAAELPLLRVFNITKVY
jgi:hypothetical protein